MTTFHCDYILDTPACSSVMPLLWYKETTNYLEHQCKHCIISMICIHLLTCPTL